jgi:hypothetical protein
MVGRWPSALVLLFAALVPAWNAPVRAQSETGATIKGTVVDDSTGAPLPNTHVFISGSTLGTTVDEDGRFRLPEVPHGAKRLYVTRLGYEPEQRDLLLRRDTTLTFSFRLSPTVITADTITVTAERDEEWYERLARFKRLFIGESPQARRCYLLNPEVLYFDTAWWGKFEAAARGPLRFENRALGYRVTYYLKEFEQNGNVVRWDGEPVFEVLSPQDSAQARTWARNRRRAFEGSLRHFLLALVNDRLEKEDFQIHRLPRFRAYRRTGWADRLPARATRIVEAPSDSLYEVDVRGALEVIYKGEPESEAFLDWAQTRRRPRSHQVSLIELNEHPIHVDRHGEIVEPYGATLYKYFAFTQRMAELLPREYRPTDRALAATGKEQ